MRKFLALMLASSLLLLAFPAGAEEGVTDTTGANVVPVIKVGGAITERKSPMSLFGGGGESNTLDSLKEKLEKAKTDNSVLAVVLRFESPSWGIGTAMDFHDAMLDFRESGKPLYVSYDYAGLGTYAVSTAATEIIIPEVGMLELLGINLTTFYYKGLLDKLGIQGDGLNTGKFKDAFDPFIKDKMGEGTRIQLSALMEDIFSEMVNAVAKNRGIDKRKAFELLTLGPYTSSKAVAVGAVDRVSDLPAFFDALEDEMGRDLTFEHEYAAAKKKEKPNFMALFMGGMSGKSASTDKEPKIAVVYATGPIVDGRADKSNPFAQSESIASDDFIDLFNKVAEEEGLKAIVLRVDSPGGSAIASDRIWSRLEDFQKDGIPVVASMASVAASGGYYISMGADKIFASPTTITGSIGVVGGKFAMGGLYEKIGLSRESLSIGKHSDLYNESRPWNDEERKILMEMLDDIYNVFTSKVAEGRGMTQDRVKELGGGRVWSGIDAKENGLIDELGGLEAAIAAARELADAAEAKVVTFPKEKNLMEILEEALTLNISASATSSLIESQPAWQAARAILPEAHLRHLAFMVQSMMNRPAAMTVLTLSIDLNID